MPAAFRERYDPECQVHESRLGSDPGMARWVYVPAPPASSMTVTAEGTLAAVGSMAAW
jgi:hypothetical protein